VVLLVGWMNGDLRRASQDDVHWERYRFNATDQRALAEFLAADYDERAEVIYLVTSGYSKNGASTASNFRMRQILTGLDRCLKQGASIVRLQIQPDGPLLDTYIDWVCSQMREYGDRCSAADVTDQVGLPSMAVVRRKDKSGSSRATVELVAPGTTGQLARQAVFAWRIEYPPKSQALAALIECLDQFAEQGVNLTTPEKYREFTNRLSEAHLAKTTITRSTASL